jgi:hypothetical protein
MPMQIKFRLLVMTCPRIGCPKALVNSFGYQELPKLPPFSWFLSFLNGRSGSESAQLIKLTQMAQIGQEVRAGMNLGKSLLSIP